MISQDNKSGFRNTWVWGVLGLIAVVLAVNGVFIWFATHNKSTLVDVEYKTRDRKANTQMLSELGAQQALAWKTTIKNPPSIVQNIPAVYEIAIADRDGKPVSGVMEVEAYRAADPSKDFITDFKESSVGNYQGSIAFPLKGYWELRIHVKRGSDESSVNTARFKVAEAS